MRKIVICEHCDSQIDIRIRCDICGRNLDMYDIKLMPKPIELNILDTTYDFCNLKCLLKFVLAELRKENPRNDIITGGKK